MQMTQIRVGDQVVAHDRDATELVYLKIERGDADECGCLSCLNFAAQRASALPGSFRALLAGLGVDPMKEGEVYECGPTSNGGHQYGGWFYLRGEIIESGERNVNAPDAPDFQFWFTSHCPDAPAFQGGPLIAIEFLTKIEWVLPSRHEA